MWPLGADCCQLRLVEVSLRCNLDVSRYAFVIEAVPLFLGQVLRKTTVGPVASPLAQTIGPFVTNLKLLGNNLTRSISETLSVGIADWGTDFESRGGHSSVRPEDFVLFSRQWLTWVPVTQVKN